MLKNKLLQYLHSLTKWVSGPPPLPPTQAEVNLGSLAPAKLRFHVLTKDEEKRNNIRPSEVRPSEWVDQEPLPWDEYRELYAKARIIVDEMSLAQENFRWPDPWPEHCQDSIDWLRPDQSYYDRLTKKKYTWTYKKT